MSEVDQSRNYRGGPRGAYHSLEVSSFATKNENNARRYSNSLEFWLSCLGYAVGYGNIWRLPYMLYSNGGGVFFIPYVICIIVLVLPLSYLEISYGQVYRRAVHHYHDKIHPRLIGFSFGISTIIFLISIYFMTLIAWWFTFFLLSFQSPLPWAPKEGKEHHESFVSDKYFIDEFLNRSEGLFDITGYQPWIMVSMVVVVAFTFGTIFKGIDTAKYVVYVMVPLPYFLLTVMFIKGVTLEGFTVGWAYLFKPDWSKLATLKVWNDAAAQVLFSSGIAQNVMIKFASHRSEDDPILNSTIVLPFLNFGTSIFAALTLFSFIGYASHHTGIPIDDMPLGGMELTYVVYPALLNTLPFPQCWAVIFFLMLTWLGLGSEYIYIECCSSLIHGTLSRKAKLKWSQTKFTFIICCIILVLNLVFFASTAGYYWLEMMDHYATGINLVIYLFMQIIIFVYMLPLSALEEKVNRFGEKFPKMYDIPLKFICPLFTLFLAAIAIINELKYPPLSDSFFVKFISYLVMASPTIMLIIFAVWNPFAKKQKKPKDNMDTELNKL